MVHGFRQCEYAGAAHSSPGWLEPRDAIHAGREADRASRIAAKRAVAETHRSGDARTARRHARPMPSAPWIYRGFDRRMMCAERAFRQLQLAQQNCAGLPQAGDDGGIPTRAIILVDGHAGCRCNALGMAEILHRNWDTMQRAAKTATGDLAVGLLRLRQRQLRGGLGIAFEPWIEICDAIEHRLRYLQRGKLARLDAAADLDEVEIAKFIRGHRSFPSMLPPCKACAG